MAGDFFPRRNVDFVAWSGNLRRRLVAEPQANGVTEQQAARYAALDDALSAAFGRTANPKACSTADRVARDQARAAAEEAARELSGMIKAQSAVSAERKSLLGLNPRGRGGRHAAIRPPERPPAVTLAVVGARRVEVHMFDLDVARRRRPKGAAGAMVWTFTGESAPDDIGRWQCRGGTTKPTLTIDFPAHLPPGTRVWVRAVWISPRCAHGPLSAAIATRLPGEGVCLSPARRRAA